MSVYPARPEQACAADRPVGSELVLGLIQFYASYTRRCSATYCSLVSHTNRNNYNKIYFCSIVVRIKAYNPQQKEWGTRQCLNKQWLVWIIGNVALTALIQKKTISAFGFNSPGAGWQRCWYWWQKLPFLAAASLVEDPRTTYPVVFSPLTWICLTLGSYPTLMFSFNIQRHFMHSSWILSQVRKAGTGETLTRFLENSILHWW